MSHSSTNIPTCLSPGSKSASVNLFGGDQLTPSTIGEILADVVLSEVGALAEGWQVHFRTVLVGACCLIAKLSKLHAGKTLFTPSSVIEAIMNEQLPLGARIRDSDRWRLSVLARDVVLAAGNIGSSVTQAISGGRIGVAVCKSE